MSLDQPAEIVKHQSLTHDAFLGGRLLVTQPRNGFRAGLDSVLLGAATSPQTRHLLDLGAGVGAASLVALAHTPGCVATLVDHNSEMLALARANAQANGMEERTTIVECDVAARGRARADAGLLANHFTSVIANPPFFEGHAGTLARDVGRAAARHMPTGMLDFWLKTAAGSAAPGGEVIFVYPASSLAALLAGFDQRFGAIIILPLVPREGEAVSRVLVRGIKGSRAPLTMLAARALHGAEGRQFTPAFDAIFRGGARLHW